jgi:hypothetical protein
MDYFNNKIAYGSKSWPILTERKRTLFSTFKKFTFSPQSSVTLLEIRYASRKSIEIELAIVN